MNILNETIDTLELLLANESLPNPGKTEGVITQLIGKVNDFKWKSIQQRIDDLLNAEYEALKSQAIAICEEKELDASFFDLNDSVEMEYIDEQESNYADNFDFEMDMARTYEDSWLWSEMTYGQKLDILQEIKETIQSLLNPTT